MSRSTPHPPIRLSSIPAGPSQPPGAGAGLTGPSGRLDPIDLRCTPDVSGSGGDRGWLHWSDWSQHRSIEQAEHMREALRRL